MGQHGGTEERYVRERLLGEGGAGRVWLVEDRLRPGTRLALKEPVETDAAPAARHEEELRREFATLLCLRHPNLVEVHDFEVSSESGLPRFTLEFIQGRNIVDAVAHEGPSSFLSLAVEALRALAFVHDCRLIHCDLKPDNLLVRDRPKLGCRLVLVDFGLARAAGPRSEPSRAKGTLPYLAPELLGEDSWTRRSDLYALGAVLYEAVFGRPPVVPDEADLGRFLQRVREGRRPRPPVPEGYPKGLGEWFEEMLAPAPEDRPGTAAEALARLNAACGTRHPAETPVSRAARLRSGLPAERQAEISRLWSELEPGVSPVVVWLAGGPGSGKTRVLRWIEAEAMLRGWHVVGPASRGRVALQELRQDATKGPTLLLLDDVDASDGRVVELLERIAREGHAAPVRAVATLTPSRIQHPALRKLYAETGIVPTLREVELGRLDEAGVRAMASRATAGPVSDERVRWLLAASEGLPALAESLLVDGRWEKGASPAGLPASGSISLGRVDMLPVHARAWLEALAVVDGDSEDSLLAELSGLEPLLARVAADEVASAGLAYRRGARWFPDSRHLTEHLRSGIEPERRRALHRRAAELLAGKDPGSAVGTYRLARLWARAGERSLALGCAVRAAEQAAADGEPAEAAERYGDALRWADRRDTRRFELRLGQAECRMRAGLYAGAARAYGAARRLAPDASSRVRAMTAQAGALVQAGRFHRALDLAERAEALAAQTGDREQQAQAQRAAGIVLGRLGREREAMAVLARARSVFRERGRRGAEAETLQALATCQLRLGSAEAAEAMFLEAIELYRKAASEDPAFRDEGGGLKCQVGLAILRARSGRRDEAVDLLTQVRDAAAAQGSLSLHEVALSRLASVAIDQGKLDRAVALAEQAADLALHLGDQNLFLLDRMRHADALVRCGRPGEAAELLRQALARPLGQVEPENLDYARMLLAEACIESGNADPAEVRSLLEESLRGCRRRRKPRPLLMAMVIDLQRRARPDSEDPFEPAETEFASTARRFGDALDPEIRFRAEAARAASRLCRGDLEAAAEAAERAARVADEGGLPAFGALAEALRAEAFARGGREEDARRARGTGRQWLEEAASRIDSDDLREDFLRRPAFAPLRKDDSPSSDAAQGRLLAMYDMIRVLNSTTDPDALLESILDMALRAVGGERGMILLKDPEGSTEPPGFSVRVARNLEEATVRDVESYSRSIVHAASAGRSLLAVDATTDQRFRDLKSVSLYGIRSLMCVPLRSRGKIIGTVYLDRRREGSIFTPEDLRFLEAFADHAALALGNAQARVQLERQNRRLQAAAATRTEFANLVGRSPGMQAVFDLVEKVATSDLPVLIQGESGTGKELVARAIHAHGPRRHRTFLTENCASIPETLLETELFGHERGAFTGAERDHPGLFEQAHHGTLLLDEVGDMSPAMQARLLRVLEEGEVRRVGGDRPVRIDVRILAASHRDLAAEVRAGRFRQDLLYRIQVLTVGIPPLRERPGDVELLTRHFLARIAKERGREPTPIDDEVLGLFERYRWPGNVRELEHALQRLVLLAGKGAITMELIDSDSVLRQTLLRQARAGEPLFSLAWGEREQIQRALAACRGSRRRAAELLGVSRATIYRKIRQHGLG